MTQRFSALAAFLLVATASALGFASTAVAQVALTCPTRNHPNVPNNPACQPGFPAAVTQIGNDLAIYGSPTVTNITGDARPEIVFGTRNGYVVVLNHLGQRVWSYDTGEVPILSKPAVADIDGDGKVEIVVSAGAASHLGGGVYVISDTGTLQCSYTDIGPSNPQGFYSSPALGRLQPGPGKTLQIAVGGFDFRIHAIRHDCSSYWIKAIDDLVVDSVWSSPSLVDLDSNGQLDVVIGQDSNAQTINGVALPDGGMIRAFRGDGSGELPGFPYFIDEVIYSSPAVADLTGDGMLDIVFGNGRCWDMASCTSRPHAVRKAIFSLRANGSPTPGFPFLTPGESARTASPALADLDGDGDLEVVLNTLLADDVNGRVHVIRPDGTPLPGWPRQPEIPATCTPGDVRRDGTVASPVVADLTGDGQLEVIVPAANELVIWSRSGEQLTTRNGCPAETGKFSLFTANDSIFSTPAVADLDGDGDLEVIATATAAVPGQTGGFATVFVWSFAGSSAAPGRLPWPEFRHDARNTGAIQGASGFLFGDSFEPR